MLRNSLWDEARLDVSWYRHFYYFLGSSVLRQVYLQAQLAGADFVEVPRWPTMACILRIVTRPYYSDEALRLALRTCVKR